jgi:hypothetical protein
MSKRTAGFAGDPAARAARMELVHLRAIEGAQLPPDPLARMSVICLFGPNLAGAPS